MIYRKVTNKNDTESYRRILTPGRMGWGKLDGNKSR